MAKDRQHTEQRLLQAVSEIVQSQGFVALGVNAVAEQAGVSKMLIYRYFESYEGLLKEWSLRNNFWAEISEQALAQINSTEASTAKDSEGQLEGGQKYGRILGSLLRQQADSLRASVLRREVIRWMLTEENEVSLQAMQQVEQMGLSISQAFRERISSERDLEAAVGVLIGGVYYLALVSDRTEVFNGIDLHSDEGWSRIKRSVDLMIELLFDKYEE